MNARVMTLTLFVAALGASSTAAALPRFSARTGADCRQCHVNPTGGGMRNAYGRNVFAQAWLPWSATPDEHEDPFAEPPPSDDALEMDTSFSPELTDWLALGADLRTAYIFIRPDERLPGERDRRIINSFFLMQADLYHAAELSRWLTLSLDVGVYSGFEAWALVDLRPRAPPDGLQLQLKVGRFLPPFGVRQVDHQLFTRERVGLGAADRDTGLELIAALGPLTAAVALMNGTLGSAPLDAPGTERRAFEKAIAATVSVRSVVGSVRAQLGASAYFTQNMNQANPLFSAAIPAGLVPGVARGLDELRADVFASVNIGRFTYLADVVLVRDDFYARGVPRFAGYASYQELSFLPTQGLDLMLTAEFMEPDIDVADDTTQRFGAVVELFPVPFTEVRAMVRRTLDETATTSGVWDAVLFAHFYF